MGFTREQLESFRDATVDDLVGDDVRLVIVGINPGLWTAATNTHFAHPGNRFYPALHLAGITTHQIDQAAGFTPEDREHLVGRGVAITNICPRATARADELSRRELREGAQQLVDRLESWQPQVIAIAGITAYRQAFGRPSAAKGRQEVRLAGARLWLCGNPSGLNAHETVETLARQYRAAAEEAGVTLDAPRW